MSGKIAFMTYMLKYIDYLAILIFFQNFLKLQGFSSKSRNFTQVFDIVIFLLFTEFTMLPSRLI